MTSECKRTREIQDSKIEVPVGIWIENQTSAGASRKTHDDAIATMSAL